MEKKCSECGADISHKTSNSSSKCEKCLRKPSPKQLDKISKRSKGIRPIRNDVLDAYNYSCAICGWSMDEDIKNTKRSLQSGCEIHHIISVSDGGKDEFDNLILLCPNHHKEADYGVITPLELIKYIPSEDVIIMNRVERLSKAMALLDNIY